MTTATNEQAWARKHSQHRQLERNILILLQDAEDKGQEDVYLEKQQHEEFSQRFRLDGKWWASQARHLLLSTPTQGYPSDLLPSANKEKLISKLLSENTDGQWPAGTVL